jgi:hypothetical protein
MEVWFPPHESSATKVPWMTRNRINANVVAQTLKKVHLIEL